MQGIDGITIYSLLYKIYVRVEGVTSMLYLSCPQV